MLSPNTWIIPIMWPTRENVYMTSPLAFRYRYRKVPSIIDCFEIEIEKPSDAINQALTWSDYKKYSITPDGFINHISQGACGRYL